MSWAMGDDNASRQTPAPLFPRESEALGLFHADDIHEDTDDNFSSPAPSTKEPTTLPVRNAVESTLEKTERRDEVEPGLSDFRTKRDLHLAQLKDIYKKAGMVDNRIDKLNDDVEKLRAQWGEVEREKAALLTSKERYQQKIATQRKVVRKDDLKAKKYHAYLTLAEEVLDLNSEDDEDEDSFMYDWGAQGQAVDEDEQEQEHEQ